MKAEFQMDQIPITNSTIQCQLFEYQIIQTIRYNSDFHLKKNEKVMIVRDDPIVTYLLNIGILLNFFKPLPPGISAYTTTFSRALFLAKCWTLAII